MKKKLLFYHKKAVSNALDSSRVEAIVCISQRETSHYQFS